MLPLSLAILIILLTGMGALTTIRYLFPGSKP